MFDWFDYINITWLVEYFRESSPIRNLNLPHWIIYSFPDASWVLFGTCMIAFIWGFRLSSWIFFFPCVGILSEALQFFRVLPGTFDLIDVILLLLASVLPFLIFYKNQFDSRSYTFAAVLCL